MHKIRIYLLRKLVFIFSISIIAIPVILFAIFRLAIPHNITHEKGGFQMAEQCYAYARRMWNNKYPKNKLVEDSEIITGPQLWENAADVGYRTSSSKAIANSIVCWDDGGSGHVAWVRSVNTDGSMNISESNWPIDSGPQSRNNIAFGTRGSTGSFKLLGCVYP